MTREERAKFVEDYLDDYIRPVLGAKGDEYNVGGDVNGNFKKAAAEVMNDYEPWYGTRVVWHIYFSKHLDSIRNFIKKGEVRCGEHIYNRIGDAICYLLILASMIEEVTSAKKRSDGKDR